MENITRILQRSYLEAPEHRAIHLLFSRQADRHLTYRDLLHGSEIYARALRNAGIEKGEVVILILQHGEDLVTSFFGAILRGAIPSIMPFLTEKLRPKQYRASLAALFEITKPAGVITYPEFINEVRQASQGTSVRAVLECEEIARTIRRQEELLDFETLGGLNCAPEEVVLLQHSSGTTGLQKGVALSHQAVFNQLQSYSRALGLNADDVVVSWLPLYHDMGLIAGFILPILSRTPLVLMSPFDWVRAPYRLMQAISDYQGTLCWLPNFAYNFCAQKIRDRHMEGSDLSSLRAVINCSEPMHWKSHEMFLERFRPYGLRAEALATSYAMAENVFAVTQGGIDSPVVHDEIDQPTFLGEQVAQPANSGNTITMLSAGRPIDGTQIRIVDPYGSEQPERHIGEIILKSNCMLSGYYHRPDLTEKAFRDGWYLTGDLGYLAEGELFVTGRMKDLIIVGGKNVYPQDLERLAGEVGGVYPGRVVAFGVFSEVTGTEEVVVIAEVDYDFNPTLKEDSIVEEIAAQIREQVTRGSDVALRYVHVVPRNWLIKTSSGKISRSANRQKYLDQYSHS
jgi:acyl-CoA synthetase (AMP-forming)/AMP-acid ligase II